LNGALLSTGYVFMAWYLVKDRENFTFPYTIGVILKFL